MSVKTTASLIVICLLWLTLEAKAQKNGFRGGSKSYEIHVEASPVGTNLHYELPESKVKAASKQDWKVDNDNADMLAINSPVLATVNVKHPKFSMKGQWPGYKTSFKVPKDVSVASKRTDFSKSNPVKHLALEEKAVEQHNVDISGSSRASGGRAKVNSQTAGSGFFLSKIAEKFLKRKTPGTKSRHEDSGEILSISRLLLPIAGIKNIDLKNPHVNKAMKGVIKNARKVVDEAKTVLNDAANFVTRVRKLVIVTEDQTKMKIKEANASVVAKETEMGSKGFATQSSKYSASLSGERDQEESGGHKIGEGVKIHDLKGRQTLQTNLSDQKHDGKAKQGNEKKEISKKQDDSRINDVSKRSYLDSLETEKAHDEQFKGKIPRVKRRGLPETLESILSTISGIKNLLRYR